MRSSFVSSLFHMKPMYRTFPRIVVVGSAKSDDPRYCVPKASVCAVPLSLMRTISLSPLTGVPAGLVNVAPTARAVSMYTSVVEKSGAGVEEEAVEVTRGSMRLFVSVCVEVS